MTSQLAKTSEAFDLQGNNYVKGLKPQKCVLIIDTTGYDQQIKYNEWDFSFSGYLLIHAKSCCHKVTYT